MEKDKLIELLNEALQIEYTDVFLYPRQAERIKEKEISEKFERFGRMELRHADTIAIEIQKLGGQPNWDFAPIVLKESMDEILLDHLERERKAMQFFSKLIEDLNKEGQDQLKLILEGIRSEEGSHFGAINQLIEKRKTR